MYFCKQIFHPSLDILHRGSAFNIVDETNNKHSMNVLCVIP